MLVTVCYLVVCSSLCLFFVACFDCGLGFGYLFQLLDLLIWCCAYVLISVRLIVGTVTWLLFGGLCLFVCWLVYLLMLCWFCGLLVGFVWLMCLLFGFCSFMLDCLFGVVFDYLVLMVWFGNSVAGLLYMVWDLRCTVCIKVCITVISGCGGSCELLLVDNGLVIYVVLVLTCACILFVLFVWYWWCLVLCCFGFLFMYCLFSGICWLIECVGLL